MSKSKAADCYTGRDNHVLESALFSTRFELPNGRKLVTLRDAALYIAKLPMAEHDAEE